MNVFEIVGAIVMIIVSILTVIVTALQQSKGDAMSSLAGGGMESFFGQNTNRTYEAMLARLTRILAIVFFVITIAVYALNVYMVA